jgi:hypothetical protein
LILVILKLPLLHPNQLLLLTQLNLKALHQQEYQAEEEEGEVLEEEEEVLVVLQVHLLK